MSMGIVLHEYGGPEVLKWEAMELDPPAAGEIRIAHRAIGMNLMEVGLRVGGYPGPDLPFIPGVEAAGVVSPTRSTLSNYHITIEQPLEAPRSISVELQLTCVPAKQLTNARINYAHGVRRRSEQHLAMTPA